MLKTGLLKFLAYGFIVSGLFFFLGKSEMFPDFYEPRKMGVLAFIYAFFIVLPALVFRLSDSLDEAVLTRRQRALTDLQTAIGLSFFADSAGALGLYEFQKIGFEYDKLAHFAVVLILTVSLARFIIGWYGLTIRRALLWTVSIVVFGEFLWEFTEYSIDRLFGTTTFGLKGTNIVVDTALDLTLGTFGILVGVVMVLRNKDR